MLKNKYSKSVLRTIPSRNHKPCNHLGQSIQEWNRWNLWKTAFKNFQLVHSWTFGPIYDTAFLQNKLTARRWIFPYFTRMTKRGYANTKYVAYDM